MFLRKQVGEYTVDIVYSALQKSIRRGLAEDAVFWGKTLYDHGYFNALLGRLMVIAVEDCSPNLSLCVYLDDLYEKATKLVGKKNLKIESLRHPQVWSYCREAITLLCSAGKSRCLNHLLVLGRKQLTEMDELPDDANFVEKQLRDVVSDDNHLSNNDLVDLVKWAIMMCVLGKEKVFGRY